jgi:hypothetical protein
VVLLAAGGSFMTLKDRGRAMASASFVNPGAPADNDSIRSAGASVMPAPVVVGAGAFVPVSVAPVAPPEPPVLEAPINPVAPVAPVLAMPQQEVAPLPVQVAPQRPRPVAVTQAPAPHVERPAPVVREAPAPPPAVTSAKRAKGGATDEEKRAADEAHKLAEKQLEQSL